MAKSYLEKLELAFYELSELESADARDQFLLDLEKTDPELSSELRQILDEANSSNNGLDISEASFLSLEDTRLGEENGHDFYGELLELLKLVSPSQNQNVLGELEGFELQRLVGVGPFGFVFKAWDQMLQRQVAIKVLSPSIANDPKKKALFVAEARLASSVRSSNVATIFHIHFSDQPNLAFFVMEWIEATSLKDWVDKHNDKDIDSAVEFFKQLVNAVSEIHGKGIVHRDLKPANVLIETKTNRLVVVDFGLAFGTDDVDGTSAPAGTPLFMAPEQLLGENVTSASDQFALAEIACLMFFGFHPHKKDSLELLTDHVLNSPPELSNREGINAETKRVLTIALSKNPSERFETANEFGRRFLQAIGYEGSEQSPGSIRRNRAIVTIIGAFVVTCVLVVLAINAWKPGRNQVPIDANKPLQKESPGKWLDEDRFENFAGIEFRQLKFDGRGISEWPPDPEHPELFAELGWRNMNLDVLIGESLIDQKVYDSIVENGSLEANSQSDFRPVTNISLTEAKAFCKKLTDRDPDGIVYGICNTNIWAFAAYGKAILVDKVPPAKIVDDYRSRSASSQFSQVPDAFGEHLEWTFREKRTRTRLDGVVPFDERHPLAAAKFVEVIGGRTHGLFVHAFDMNFGVNDHLQSSTGLEFHVEEDGETCYLHPAKTGEESSLIYTYQVPEIVSANIRSPFSLFAANSHAGIRIRGKRDSDQIQLEACEWKDVLELNGKHYPQDNRMIDVTQLVKGYSEIQIQYWIMTEDKRLRYAQFGRTSMQSKLPDVCSIEFVTKDGRTSPRQSYLVPRSYKSPFVSFRVVAFLPKSIDRSDQ